MNQKETPASTYFNIKNKDFKVILLYTSTNIIECIFEMRYYIKYLYRILIFDIFNFDMYWLKQGDYWCTAVSGFMMTVCYYRNLYYCCPSSFQVIDQIPDKYFFYSTLNRPGRVLAYAGRLLVHCSI